MKATKTPAPRRAGTAASKRDVKWVVDRIAWLRENDPAEFVKVIESIDRLVARRSKNS